MEKLITKLDPKDVQTLLELMKMSKGGEASTHSQPVKLDLPHVDLKLDGPATYLSWSRRIKGALAGRNLEGFLTGEKEEPERDTAGWNEWKTTHMLLYTWLLNSMVQSIAVTVDGIQNVKDIWTKLRRIYAGAENNMRVFQIEREIEAVMQGDRSVQEYATELERLWADYKYFSPIACCKDSECKRGERDAQRRTMHFLRRLNPTFGQRSAVLLAQTRIPSLDEAIAAMIQEESRIGLQAEAGGLPRMQSALVVSNLGNKEVRGETRKCYNCGEVGHLSKACPRPPRERETYGRGQFGGRGGRRDGQTGSYRANLMVAEEEGVTDLAFTKEDQELLEMLRRKKLASNGGKKPMTEEDSTSLSSRGNVATYAHTAKGAASGFSSYTHLAVPESIQTADGTTQPVVGKGTVRCTKSVTLSNVLHAPSFPVNLLSISAIILQLKCVVSFDIPKVIFQEKGTGRILGTGTWHSGLWYLDKEGMDSALTSVVEKSGVGEFGRSVEDELLLHHRRMGHSSFGVLRFLYPSLYEKANRQKLVCDACEFGKHTRRSYVGSGNRSSGNFDLIHSDVWGPCSTTSMNGYRYFVTFIDCYSRVTWLYLMKNKSDVLACFKDFHMAIQTQYGAVVKVLRSDNGTEYTNKAFGEYLSSQGIQHQTTCPYTPAQNGVAERKNRHLLEVARSMMISMNVPKYLWGQAVLAAAQLINRMPSRVLEQQTPCEVLKGDNGGILPLKVFGCVCFVKDNRPTVGKLDPRAVKCVFVGYSGTQKGYVCWSPVERRLFVSMDVTFREHEPYYSLEVTSPFGDSPHDTGGIRREGEKSQDGRVVIMGAIPCPILREELAKDEPDNVETESEGSGVHAQGELRVYTRRRKQNEGSLPTTPLVPTSPLSRPTSTLETYSTTGDMIPLPLSSPPMTSMKSSHSNAGHPPDRYGYNIAHFISYSNISPTHGAFIASLDTVSISKCWQVAKEDPKWKAAMQEELGALDKNKTWEIVSLPARKKAVGCKWVFTVNMPKDRNCPV